MLRLTAKWLKTHQLHPKAYAVQQVQQKKPTLRAPKAPVVLDGLDPRAREDIKVWGAGNNSKQLLEKVSSSPSQMKSGESSDETAVSVQQLWNATRVARQNRDVRRTQGTCVVGSASAIQRIWRRYKISPTVVYVPATDAVPPWCLEEELPSYVVRCSPVEVKRHLLSAEYSDGYAAEFPLSPHCIRPATGLLKESGGGDGEHGEGSGAVKLEDPKSTLVLVGLRIPSNLGQLVWAAVENGFRRVVMVNCVDVLNEKVLRASQGTVFDPRLEVYEHNVEGRSSIPLLCAIAAQHRLVPVLAVPSQEAEPAFAIAKRLHRHNHWCRQGSPARPQDRVAPMLVLGSEARGLADLEGEWNVPYLTTTIPLPNSLIDSYNVGVAGSILLNLFRPAAETHFAKVDQHTGESIEQEGGLFPIPAAESPINELQT